MDQSVTRTQYDPGTIRKFKRMSCVAALLMVLLLRGDRAGGVERSAASPVARAKYTRAAVKYTALILAFKLAALAAFALKVGPEL